jgi:hypothetical protein
MSKFIRDIEQQKFRLKRVPGTDDDIHTFIWDKR